MVLSPSVMAVAAGKALFEETPSVPLGTNTSPEKLAGAPNVSRLVPSLVKSVSPMNGEFSVVSASAITVIAPAG